MKIKDLQNVVLSQYQKGDSPTEMHLDLNDGISLATIKSWYYIIHQSATRYTCWSTNSQGTKENIQKVKNCLHRKQKVSASKHSRELLQQVLEEF